jgi:hypothetical protein
MPFLCYFFKKVDYTYALITDKDPSSAQLKQIQQIYKIIKEKPQKISVDLDIFRKHIADLQAHLEGTSTFKLFEAPQNNQKMMYSQPS